MDLFLDTADVSAWQDLMPTGMFTGITTNPLLASRAGLDYANINWSDMAQRAAGLGAKELHGQVYGPVGSYVDFAAQLYEAGKRAGIDTVVKIPLTEAGIRSVPLVKPLGGRILMTAAHDAKQICVAIALGADYIAPYFGRMLEADLPAFDSLQDMQRIREGSGIRVMVASLRNTEQIVRLARDGLDCFTISPDIAYSLLADPMTDAAAKAFEVAAAGHCEV